MRQLIINGDDFGLTEGVNHAIVEAHQAGVLTSATLMAQGSEFDEAVRLSASVPSLSVGCHVVLIGGSPLLPTAQVPSLLGSEGSFRRTWGSFAAAALGGRLSAQEIEAEAIAQIRKLQQAGVPVTHLDTHKHTHLFPQVLQPLLRAAEACGVGAIRNPFEPVQWGLLGKNIRVWERWLGIGVLRAFSGTFRRMVADAGVMSPDGSLGIASTGLWNAPQFHSMIESVPQGTWELVCHPGYNDAQLHAMPTRLRESRQKELEILTSPEIPALLAKNGIHLISYRDWYTSRHDRAGQRVSQSTQHSSGAAPTS